MSPETQIFFSGCKNPFNVSELITSLAAGNQLKSELVPVEVLPHVTLLATIGLRSYQQQIIDDYEVLLRRMQEVLATSDVTRTLENGEQYAWFPGLQLVNTIALYGPRGEYDLDELYDAAYMFKVYEELIHGNVDELFSWLGTTAGNESDAPSQSVGQKTQSRSKRAHAKKAGRK